MLAAVQFAELILAGQRRRHMRRRIILAGALAVLPAIAMAQKKEKDKTLRERLQGEWARTNHRFSFKVQGDQWTHYDERVPLKATGTGVIIFPKGKDYAIVTTQNGHVWWLFSAGENVVAIETFDPNGGVTSDTGRVYYRNGTRTP
jgi:hypothetical protein